ncbi:MAG: hypothetical protein QOE90_788 [Thermoplasmata archaeon]|jgi:hypothetical protein|nr:hypothetical protein [Thermoplasmata archaeon]
MTAPTATVPPARKTSPADLVHATEANEWGQIVNLEPHAQYFVVRRPTAQVTREVSNQMLEDLKALVAAQREVAEKQVAEINEKVLPRALDTYQKARGELEKRMDQLTREFEARVEKLEAEFGERAPSFLRREKREEGTTTASGEPAAGSAPGELPMGNDNGGSSTADEKPASRKKSGKKSE